VLHRHLLRTLGADCVDALLRFLAADGGIGEEGEGEEGAAPSPLVDAAAGPLSAAQRATILKQLPPDVKPAVADAIDKLGGGSLQVGAAGGRMSKGWDHARHCWH
jgi:hypothetical protein